MKEEFIRANTIKWKFKILLQCKEHQMCFIHFWLDRPKSELGPHWNMLILALIV